MMEIQQKLVTAGAKAIMTEYGEDGAPSGFSFLIETPYGDRGFQLPVHAERVHAVLLRQSSKNGRVRTEKAHAERVAWRIIKDWLEAQLALIETEMVTLDQVMLPYMTTSDGGSLYELVVKNQMALPKGGEGV